MSKKDNTNTPELVDRRNVTIPRLKDNFIEWWSSEQNMYLKVYGDKYVGTTRVVEEAINMCIEEFSKTTPYILKLSDDRPISNGAFLNKLYGLVKERNKIYSLLVFMKKNILLLGLELIALVVSNLFRINIVLPGTVIIGSVMLNFILYKTQSKTQKKDSEVLRGIKRALKKKSIIFIDKVSGIDDTCIGSLNSILQVQKKHVLLIIEFKSEDEITNNIRLANLNGGLVNTFQVLPLRFNDYKTFIRNNNPDVVLKEDSIRYLHTNYNANTLLGLNLKTAIDFSKDIYSQLKLNQRERFILISILICGNEVEEETFMEILKSNVYKETLDKNHYVKSYDELIRKFFIIKVNGSLMINDFAKKLVQQNEFFVKNPLFFNAYNNLYKFILSKEIIRFSNPVRLRTLGNLFKCSIILLDSNNSDDLATKIIFNYNNESRNIKHEFIKEFTQERLHLLIKNENLKRLIISEAINFGLYLCVVDFYLHSNQELNLFDKLLHLYSLSMTNMHEKFKECYKKYSSQDGMQDNQVALLNLINLTYLIRVRSDDVFIYYKKLEDIKENSPYIYALYARAYSNPLFGKESIRLLHDSIRIFTENNNKAEKSISLLALSRKYIYFGDFRSAYKYLKKSEIYQHKNSVKDYYYTNNSVIIKALLNKSTRLEIRKLQDTLDIIENKYEKIIVANNLLALHTISNDNINARKYYDMLQNLLDNTTYSTWFLIRIFFNMHIYNIKLLNDTSYMLSLFKNLLDRNEDEQSNTFVSQVCRHILYKIDIPNTNPLKALVDFGAIFGPLSYSGLVVNPTIDMDMC